jgi:HSP20 family protein
MNLALRYIECQKTQDNPINMRKGVAGMSNLSKLVPFNRSYAFADPRSFGLLNMLDDFFNVPWPFGRNLSVNNIKVDIKDGEKAYTVEADLPGAAKEDIDLSLEEGRFTISVRSSEESENDSEGYIHRERRFASMSRSMYLPDAASDGVSAKLDNGVLKVEIPKLPHQVTRRKIEIE